MKSTFRDSLTFGCFQGYPGGVRSRFRRFLAHLWADEYPHKAAFSLARSWRALFGASWWPLEAQKSRLWVTIYFFGVHFGVLVAPSKMHIFPIFDHFWRLPGVSPELLGCQIWRLFEHCGSIFWPVRDLITSLHRLAHRRSCQNSNMGPEMCVTSYHMCAIANCGSN